MMFICDACGDTGDVDGARAYLLQRGKLHCAACGSLVRLAYLEEEFRSALNRIASILGLSGSSHLSTDVPNAVERMKARLEARIPPDTNRSGGGVSQGTWSVFAEKVVAERDALIAERDRLRAVIVHRKCWGPGLGCFTFCKGCPEKHGSRCGLAFDKEEVTP